MSGGRVREVGVATTGNGLRGGHDHLAKLPGESRHFHVANFFTTKPKVQV